VTENQARKVTGIYQPMILGAGQVRFVDAKTKTDTTKDVVFLTSITEDAVPVDWDNSREANIKVSELGNTPVEGVPFADLPSAAVIAKNYSSWEKDFSNWLFRKQKLQLLKSENLNEFSKPGETERDFRIRLQQTEEEQDIHGNRRNDHSFSVCNRTKFRHQLQWRRFRHHAR
jgi:hypothetical protein